MTNNKAALSSDPAVELLRQARDKSAVLKLRLAKLRSGAPDAPILAFEGDDDKIVYHQWIRRIDARKRYICFPCGGKGHLLSLRSSLASDRTGLSRSVYFFVDRDFDDLRGQTAGEDVFVTEYYSVENYLVDRDIIDDILQIEFHCHSSPKLRKKLIIFFDKAYDSFIERTRHHNFRLFVARKTGIEVKTIPSSINKLAKISIDSTSEGSLTAEQIISYVKDPDSTSIKLRAEFLCLDGKYRFRGKFAIAFLFKWLDQLVEENKKKGCGIFGELDNNSAFRLSEITLNSLASRSKIPTGLDEFVKTISPVN